MHRDNASLLSLALLYKASLCLPPRQQALNSPFVREMGNSEESPYERHCGDEFIHGMWSPVELMQALSVFGPDISL